MDQFRTVIDRDDLHARWQARFDLIEALLHRCDDRRRVLALAHHDDSPDGLALAVQFGDTSPNFRPPTHLGDIAHTQGRPGLVVPLYGRLGEIPRVFGVTATAHHELCSRKFDQPGAHLFVGLGDGIGHLLYRTP